MKLGIIATLMALMLATSASAYVDVTYHFNVPNVEVSAYNLNDASGSSVSGFSGSFPDGTSTDDGELTIRFPDSLAANGYGIYYVSPGYLPLEAVATWHTFGNAQAFFQDYDLQFSKLSACRAVIDEFTITNTAQTNVPVVINMEATLDATMLSAFQLTDNNLDYVPPQYKDEYYSADIEVTLSVYNSGNALVHTETQSYTLFADEYADVEFTWTPTYSGEFRADIRTDVVDDQCSSSIPGESQKEFTVLDDLPQNACYTIINGLYATPEVPKVGETVTAYFTKLSNHANDVPFGQPGSALTPIQTELDISVTGPSGVLYQDVSVVAANPTNYNEVEYQFEFTPTATGIHTITVTGEGSSNLCGVANYAETAILIMSVLDEGSYSATFQLSDAVLGTKVSGAVANMNGELIASDANGIATFSGLAPGSYAYVITHPDFETTSGTVTITDSDQHIFLSLQPGDGVDVTIPVTVVDTSEDEDDFRIKISTIRIDDQFELTSGRDVPIHLTFSNDGTAKMEHVKAVAVIQELGIRASVGSFDLGRGKEVSRMIFLPLDGHVEPGLYPVRITIHSDETTRVVYREIEVLE